MEKLQKNKMKVLIIVPAFNEEGSIEKVVETIEKKCPECDYLIVNDGSMDNTAMICKEKRFNFVSLPQNLGIGGAVQTGYKYALENNYDIAIQTDGDGQHDVAYVKEMVKLLENDEADIVIGSRFIKNEGFQSSAARRMGINFLSGLIHILTGKRVKDVTSGFRAVNRKFIRIYASDYPSDYPEPEAIVAAVMHRGRISEIPVIMNERTSGKSSINLSKSFYYMIKVSLAIIICRISFGIRRGGK